MGISENNVVSQLDLLVSEKLEKLPSLERKKILGQVFTPEILAGFMASIIKKELQPARTILDPCIGPNSFFPHFEDPGFNPSLLGIEVDKTLITPAIEAFFKAPDRQLDSFLSYPLSNKFDFCYSEPSIRSPGITGQWNQHQRDCDQKYWCRNSRSDPFSIEPVCLFPDKGHSTSER